MAASKSKGARQRSALRARGASGRHPLSRQCRRFLLAFELAEQEVDPVARQELLTFVVVGGGATGVEMAGGNCRARNAPVSGSGVRGSEVQRFRFQAAGRLFHRKLQIGGPPF
jgi:hypothetical protein